MNEQDLVRRLEECVRHATFENRPWLTEPAFTSSKRHRIDGTSEIEIIYQFPTKLRPTIEHFKELETLLRQTMVEYVDENTDRFGNALLQISCGNDTNYHTLIGAFANTLISASSTLGTQCVVTRFLDWVRGDPLRFRICGLLVGIYVEENLTLHESVKLTPLPYDSKTIDNIHPDLSKMVSRSCDYPSITLISFDCEASPVFYRVENGGDFISSTHFCPIISSATQNANQSMSTICESLALSCNNAVQWIVQWRDLCEVQEFVSPFVFYETRSCDHIDPVRITHEDLLRTVDIQNQRLTKDFVNESVERAIGLWLKSKQTPSHEDKLVNLRIAFEALYELDGSTRISSNLATICKLHLGKNAKDRHKICKDIKDFYKSASRVVHGTSTSTYDLSMIQNAQNLCRTGILKRLDGIEPKNWRDLDSAIPRNSSK